MSFIWATRGRHWGFRFLRNGGYADPLPRYEAAFAGSPAGPHLYWRSETAVAVRFPDPEGRTDAAGRLIPHEFVITGTLEEEITSLEDVLERVWPQVAAEYNAIWDKPAR